MTSRQQMVSRLALMAAAAILVGSSLPAVGAASQPQRTAGVINDFVESGGSWQVNGE